MDFASCCSQTHGGKIERKDTTLLPSKDFFLLSKARNLVESALFCKDMRIVARHQSGDNPE